MARITKLVTKQQREQRAASELAAEQLALLPDDIVQILPKDAQLALSRTINALQKHTRPDDETGLWPGGFTMLSRIQTKAVWDAIRALPAKDRPNQVRHAFDIILLNLRQDTGEVMLSRDEIAAEMGCLPRNVSSIMSTLKKLGVIYTKRQKLYGVQGRGLVVYFLNPHVAWNGSLDVRKALSEEHDKPKVPEPEADIIRLSRFARQHS